MFFFPFLPFPFLLPSCFSFFFPFLPPSFLSSFSLSFLSSLLPFLSFLSPFSSSVSFLFLFPLLPSIFLPLPSLLPLLPSPLLPYSLSFPLFSLPLLLSFLSSSLLLPPTFPLPLLSPSFYLSSLSPRSSCPFLPLLPFYSSPFSPSSLPFLPSSLPLLPFFLSSPLLLPPSLPIPLFLSPFPFLLSPPSSLPSPSPPLLPFPSPLFPLDLPAPSCLSFPPLSSPFLPPFLANIGFNIRTPILTRPSSSPHLQNQRSTILFTITITILLYLLPSLPYSHNPFPFEIYSRLLLDLLVTFSLSTLTPPPILSPASSVLHHTTSFAPIPIRQYTLLIRTIPSHSPPQPLIPTQPPHFHHTLPFTTIPHLPFPPYPLPFTPPYPIRHHTLLIHPIPPPLTTPHKTQIPTNESPFCLQMDNMRLLLASLASFSLTHSSSDSPPASLLYLSLSLSDALSYSHFKFSDPSRLPSSSAFTSPFLPLPIPLSYLNPFSSLSLSL
ncbi:hypothetical protein C7M84_018981 [Penaeus vannamei]|uniref:Uncharacterized protein n=1 Tax=Penaeus vannamei TaxID=6689 RepID=A0A3R7MJ83_PENVA|nr:hypothetical protein C7M84_018981 [Penaeus vannamei]